MLFLGIFGGPKNILKLIENNCEDFWPVMLSIFSAQIFLINIILNNEGTLYLQRWDRQSVLKG